MTPSARKFVIAGGYQGTSKSGLAMERGEVEGTLKSLEALVTTHQDWLTGGKVNVIWQLALCPASILHAGSRRYFTAASYILATYSQFTRCSRNALR